MVASLTACSDEQAASPSTVTSTVERTVEHTVTVTASPDADPEKQSAATPAAEPRRPAAPAPGGGGMMDGIYADMMRDEGIDVTAGQMSQLSAQVCDAFDAGAGQEEALGIVQEVTGETGWRATRLLQGAVVNRCAQHADNTY
jgi:hypothetical protein